MTILSGQSIMRRGFLTPCHPRTEVQTSAGKISYGIGPAGYDLRLDLGRGITPRDGEDYAVLKPGEFLLAAAQEHFCMPLDALGIVHDKSSWARRGLSVFNTVIEPGWRGFLTLELVNHGQETLFLWQGTGIAQVVFHLLDEYTAQPYNGKYQDQQAGPQEAR